MRPSRSPARPTDAPPSLSRRRRRRSRTLSCAVTAVAVSAVAGPEWVRAEVPIRAERVASGLSSPIFVASPPGDNSRLFIAEQGANGTAHIKILDLNTRTVSPTPFLTVSGLVTGGEQGLLGMAFHPDYATNGQVFVHTTSPALSGGNANSIHVRRYTRSATDPNRADPASAQTVIRFNHPQSNHNGGWIGFGPRDGYLYVAVGDGGNGDDVGTGHTPDIGNAQDTTNNLLGKMLRLDVNGDDFNTDANRNYRIPRGGAGQPPANPFANTDGDDEIWAYGLRNPFRASHDRRTGDLYIGDVGQGAREEIDFQRGDSAGGENYGWRLREGTIATPGGVGGPRPPGNVDPIYDYGRDRGRTVTGGYVYRGDENTALNGTYFFADFFDDANGNAPIRALKYDGTAVTRFTDYAGRIAADVGSIHSIAAFGEDNAGNLYVVDIGGEVFRLLPAIDGDANFDDVVNLADFGVLREHFNETGAAVDWEDADFNLDGSVNLADFGILRASFGDSRTGPGAAGVSAADWAALDAFAAQVPEPSAAAAALLGAGGALLARRRRQWPNR